MKYENYGLIKEGWDKFVANPSYLEEALDDYLKQQAAPRGTFEKLMDAFKSKVRTGAGAVAMVDFINDLPTTGVSFDVFINSPVSSAMLTMVIMSYFKISKKQVIDKVKDQGPEAARTAALKTVDVSRAAWEKTVDHLDKAANDPRAPEGMKKVLNGMGALINPQDPKDLETLDNEEEVAKRVKQLTFKTADPIEPT